MKIRFKAMAIVIAAALTESLSGCNSGSSDDQVLRIAQGSPGEAEIRVWTDIATQFEKANTGWKVDLNFQKDDLYQTIGLPTLLNSKNSPDIYFEWAGERLKERTVDGFAADLSTAVTNGVLKGVIPSDWYKPVTKNSKIMMVPHKADVSNVLWYNKYLLSSNNLTPPNSWTELLHICDVLSAAGVTPIASGNKDLWAAGNWLGHLVSRVVGASVYNSALSKHSSFNTPEWKQAFGYITELREHKCINENVNAIDDNAGAQLFFQGKAALHPIGSWLVSWAIDEAPTLNFDFINLPAMPNEKNEGSVIGVVTGYVLNAKSSAAKNTKAREFLALLNSQRNVAKFIEAKAVPVAAPLNANIDSRTKRINDLLTNTSEIINPADTGYDPAVAASFYSALAEVLSGKSSADVATTELAKKLS